MIRDHAQTMRGQLQYPAIVDDHDKDLMVVEKLLDPRVASMPSTFPALPSLILISKLSAAQLRYIVY